MSVKITMTTDRDDPDEEEGVEGKDGEHRQLHHPEVARLLLHEEAGRGLQQMFELWHIIKYLLVVLHVVNQGGFLSVRIAIRIVKIGLANHIYRQLRRVKRRNIQLTIFDHEYEFRIPLDFAPVFCWPESSQLGGRQAIPSKLEASKQTRQLS